MRRILSWKKKIIEKHILIIYRRNNPNLYLVVAILPGSNVRFSFETKKCDISVRTLKIPERIFKFTRDFFLTVRRSNRKTKTNKKKRRLNGFCDLFKRKKKNGTIDYHYLVKIEVIVR